MNTYVALLRGINVGGHGKLPMADLGGIMEALGCENVATYIQSGNVVFDAADSNWADRLGEAIDDAKGFRPRVMVMSAEEFRQCAAENPFPTNEPKAMHLYFLSEPALSDADEGLAAVRSDVERFLLTDRVLYLHTPNFLTGSSIAPKAERILGVPATQRNWRTVEKLLAMLEGR